MIRCLAIDLDDTLLKTDLTIDEADQTAIRRAVAAGVKVILASGRMVQSIRPYAQLLGLNLPLIAYNGAIIQAAGSGDILYNSPVPAQAAARVLLIFRQRGIHLNAYINDQLYMDELTSWGRDYAANAGVEPHVGDLSRILSTGPAHKLLGVAASEQIDAIQAELECEFDGALQFVKSKPLYLEILAPGVSKRKALEELAASWGLNRDEVMAIGDAPNDLAMLEWAGVGVAIGNARDKVKQAADLVVADHDHQGVAEAIERAIFNLEARG
jgi:Cof subfamily protein (haloacid dehalogenase superfamily)